MGQVGGLSGKRLLGILCQTWAERAGPGPRGDGSPVEPDLSLGKERVLTSRGRRLGVSGEGEVTGGFLEEGA